MASTACFGHRCSISRHISQVLLTGVAPPRYSSYINHTKDAGACACACVRDGERPANERRPRPSQSADCHLFTTLSPDTPALPTAARKIKCPYMATCVKVNWGKKWKLVMLKGNYIRRNLFSCVYVIGYKVTIAYVFQEVRYRPSWRNSPDFRQFVRLG